MSQMSKVAESCLFTATVAACHDKRQTPSMKPYTVQSPEKRLLDAKLVLEESLELIHALGFNVVQTVGLEEGLIPKLHLTWDLVPTNEKPNLEKIIDGACDVSYVAMGCMVRMGVKEPDAHLKEVCRANDAKFPNGKAIIDKASGKYLKPPGWKPPDHKKIIQKWKKKKPN